MLFKRLTEEEKRQIIVLAEGGKKQKDLALQFGVTQPTISYLLARQGVKVVRKRTVEQIQEMRYLLKTTGTIAEVAKQFSCSLSIVHGVKSGRLYRNVPLSVKEQELESKMQQLKERRNTVVVFPTQETKDR